MQLLKTKLCRESSDESDPCILKSPFYAHATNAQNVSSILRDGLLVQPDKKRIHQNMPDQLRELCQKEGILDDVCVIRTQSTYFYADFKSATAQTLHMAGLPIPFKRPAILIANLEDKTIRIDPETFVDSAIPHKDRTKPLNELIVQYPNESIGVVANGNVAPKLITHVCYLDPAIESEYTAPFDLNDFYKYPEAYGFVEDPALLEQYKNDDDYDAYKEKLENAKYEYSEKILSNPEINLGAHYKYARDYKGAHTFAALEKEITNLENWRCTPTKKYKQTSREAQ